MSKRWFSADWWKSWSGFKKEFLYPEEASGVSVGLLPSPSEGKSQTFWVFAIAHFLLFSDAYISVWINWTACSLLASSATVKYNIYFYCFQGSTDQDCPVLLDSITVLPWFSSPSSILPGLKKYSPAGWSWWGWAYSKYSAVEAEGSIGNHWIFQFVLYLNMLHKMAGYFSRMTWLGFSNTRSPRAPLSSARMLLLS